MPSPISILLVDDDRHLADSMAQWLREQGLAVETAYEVGAAEAWLKRREFDVLLADWRLGAEDGLDLVSRTRKRHPDTAVLVITGYATPDMAVQAVRTGAFDLLTKPLIDDELMLAIERAVSQSQIARENEALRRQLDRRSGLENILSHDCRMLKIFDVIDSIADARASVLITGENGTGKSMIARAIHARSSRRGGPFVEVACGALPDTLLESELFGHVAGAFTGAASDKAGKFRLADGGTIFLDEIGTASPAMQVKLLRVLQELQFEPLGGVETVSVDTRVILATNEDLTAAVAEGRFRQDLYYRVNVVNLALPALRERPGDVPLLVDHFLREAAETCGRDIEGFDQKAMRLLQDYPWPGNIRQLENVVERAVLLAQSPRLTADDLPPEIAGRGGQGPGRRAMTADDAPVPGGHAGPGRNAGPRVGGDWAGGDWVGGDWVGGDWGGKPRPFVPAQARGKSLREALEEPERQIILQALRQHHWNRAATADALEINRTTLYKKMKRLGLDDPRLQFA